MTTRRFARFRAPGAPERPWTETVPGDGMCLSAFLVVRRADRPTEALLGRIDAAADWATLGGLDADRIRQIARRWMLPSSQLLLFESPSEAAERIAREQLGAPIPGLRGPAVFSEAYGRPTGANDPHWDLHFVFEGESPAAPPPSAPPFSELRFVDVSRTPRSEIARAQGDILELVGLRPAA